jgi:O-antigen/teichoic acid export membrane protein
MRERLATGGGMPSLARTILVFMGAQGAALALQMSATLIAARVAGPDAVGYAAWIGLFPMYAIWLTGGVLMGADLMIPLRRGAGRPDEVERIHQVACAVCLLAMAVCTVIGVAAWAGLLAAGRTGLAWKLLCAGVLSAASILNTYVSVMLVVNKHLRLLGAKFLTEGLLYWLFLPMAWGGTAGLTVRLLLVSLLGPLAFLWAGRTWIRPVWNRAMAVSLALMGIPMMAARFLLTLNYGLDRTLIAFFMNDQALGLYALAMLVMTVLKLAPYAVGRVLNPHLGELYGRTGDARRLRSALWRHIAILQAVMAPLMIAGWFAVAPLTRWLLPAYLPGVPAARVMLLSGLAVAPMSGYVFYFITRQQRVLMAILGAGLAVQVGMSLLLFTLGAGLVSFAWGLVAGMGATAVLLHVGILVLAPRIPFQKTPCQADEFDM